MFADKFLRGWMAGKYLKEQKMAQKAANEIGSLKAATDEIGRRYSEMKAEGIKDDDPQMKQIIAAGEAAKNAYLQKAGQYAIPEETKKPGIKSKLKGAFQAQQPQMFAQMALKAYGQTPFTQLYAPTQQQKLASAEAQDVEAGLKEKNEWREINKIPESQLTQQQIERRAQLERTLFGKSSAEQTKDQLLGDVMNGKSASWDPTRRQLAQQLGIIRPDVTNVQMREIKGPDGKPQTQLIAIGPDGKMVSTQVLPGNPYIPPDQAAEASRVINTQFSTIKDLYKRTHKDATDEQAGQIALSYIFGAKMNGGDWGATEAQDKLLNRAIQQVVSESKSMNLPEYEAFKNLYTRSEATGNYTLNTYAADPKIIKHWFRENESVLPYGSVDIKAMPGIETKFRGLLKAALMRQNKGMTEAEAEGIIRSPLFTEQQATGGGPPGDVNTRAGSGGAGSYKIKGPNGEYAFGGTARELSPEEVKKLESQGMTVEAQ
jgi:hypothetical protein